MTGSLSILCCQNFEPEIKAVIVAEGWTDVVVASYPVRCGRPPATWEELRPLVASDGSQVLILGRACLTGLLTPPPGWPPVRLIPQSECFHLIAGQTLVADAIERGAYLMTPAWLLNWRTQLAEMGLGEATAASFFQDFASELVLLDTGTPPGAAVELPRISEATQLPASRLAVGLDETRHILRHLVADWRLEEERRQTLERENAVASDYASQASALDFLGRLAQVDREDEAIDGIKEMMSILFAPNRLHYLRVENQLLVPDEQTPDALLAEMRCMTADWAWTASGTGFLLRISSAAETLGVIAIDDLTFPLFRDRYLNLAQSLLGGCALTIRNARNLQRFIETNKELSTARASAEAATEGAQRLKEQYEILFTTSPDAYLIMELDRGRVSDCNHAAEVMLLGSRDQIIGLSPDQLSPQFQPDGRSSEEAAAEKIADTLRDGHHRFEWVHRRFDGRDFWVEVTISLSLYEGRQALFVAWRDIDKRKLQEAELRNAELALRVSDERYERAVRGSNDGLWDWDIANNTLYMAPRFKAIIGFEENEIGSTIEDWTSRIHRDDRESTWAAMQAHLRQEKSYEEEYRLLHKSGEYIWIKARGQAVFDPTGVPLRMAGSIRDISEQKAAEFRLREMLSFNEAILLRSPLAIGVYRATGPCVLANDAYASLIGTSRQQLMTQNFQEIKGFQVSGLYEDCFAALADHQPRQREVHVTSSFSKNVWVAAHVLPTVLNSEPHVVVQFVDLSEIKQTEASLRESETRFREAFDTAPHGMALVSTEGRWLKVNQALCKIIGYTEEELLVTSFREITHPDDLKLDLDYIRAMLDGQIQTYQMEKRYFHRNGHIVWILLSVSLVRTAEGEPIHFVSQIQDISKIKAAQEQARKLAAIVKYSGDAIISENFNGLITSWNPAAEHLFGYSAEEMVGQSVERLLSVDYAEEKERLDLIRQTNPVLRAEARRITKDGRHVDVAITLSPISDDNGDNVGVVKIISDITERKRVEAALIEAQRHAEIASRAKSEFVANMSHEIRTPMNAIVGLLYLMHQTSLTDRQADYCTKMQGAANTLLGIINDILDFSKIEAGRMEIESVSFLLNTVMEHLASLANEGARSKDIELVILVQPDVPASLIGDPLRINQVLLNLTSNAIKFTNAGGEVVISVEKVAISDEEVELRFSVRDTGIGMSPEQLSRLFTPFNQADSSMSRKFGGTGLGLTISRQLVNLLGGTITIDSEEGKGTLCAFTVKFGLTEVDYKTYHEVDTIDIRSQRVLVVDDLETARQSIRAMLVRFGMEVTDVGSGGAALAELTRTAEANEKPYDIVFLDWKMAGNDGFETARAIRSDLQLKSQPMVIMVTAYDRDLAMRHASKLDLEGILVKPVTPSILLDTLHNVLRTGHKPARDSNTIKCLTPIVRRLSGCRLLLVEDNSINRQIATEILEGSGIKVESAVNGDEAVNRLANPNHGFDAVLLDLHMPVMDGYTAARHIRTQRHNQRLPIIAMTADAMAQDRERCLHEGMNDHIAKPIDVDQMFNVLRRWVRPQPDNKNPDSILNRQAVQGERILFLADELPGINLKRAQLRLQGRTAVLLSLLNEFIHQNAEDADRIDAALKNGDWEKARHLSHTLRGLAGNLGAEALSAAAAAIERGIITKSEAQLIDLQSHLRLCLETVIDSSRKLVESNPTAGAIITVKKGATELIAVAEEVILLLSRNDLRAIDIYNESLKNVLVERLGADCLAPIDAAFSMLDFDSALSTLNQILMEIRRTAPTEGHRQ